MVPDAPGVTHAACGEDDLRGLIRVERHGLLLRHGGVQILKIQRVDAPSDQVARLVVNELRARLQKHAGGLVRQWAVHIDREVRVILDQPHVLDLADEVEHLLRAANGERRDHQIAAAVERALDAVGQRGDIVRPRAVVTVAVSRFDHDIIRAVHGLRVAEDGLIDVAHVAGEDDLFFHAGLRQPRLDTRTAEQMPHVGKANHDVFADLDALAVGARTQQLQQSLHVLQIIQRLRRGQPRALGLARLPLRVGHLDVRRIAQHDTAEVARRLRRIYAAAKASLIQQRQPPGMIHVRVRHQHKVDGRCIHGNGDVFKNVLSLLHAAVDQTVMPADLQHGAASGNLMVCPDKSQFHEIAPF